VKNVVEIYFAPFWKKAVCSKDAKRKIDNPPFKVFEQNYPKIKLIFCSSRGKIIQKKG
jgi:hypothetical protein